VLAVEARFGEDSLVLVKEILQELDLGNSVAEYDAALEQYFVETSTFRSLITDDGDIIAGDKGTGKTALFRILKNRYPTLPELANVELIEAFNPSGNPIFQRLTETDPLEEGQYVTIWKAYILALVGNWILSLYEEAWTESMYELDLLLTAVGLRSSDDTPNTVFSQLVNLFRRITNPKAVEVTVTITPNGIPIVVPRVELGETETHQDLVRHDDALGLLNRVFEEIDLTAWIAFDRLDEAFQGFPRAEIPALRALMRTYLDLNAFSRLRLKLFVRKDLFARIIAGGFVNLTHVNARKIEIVWDEDDLFDLLFRRVNENQQFVTNLQVGDGDPREVFGAIFPEQVDQGERKPTTWTWIISRIRDGNGVRPPRNLIDLVKKAQEEQLRREERTGAQYEGQPIIGSDALKKGLARLSTERVQDTLLAEAGEEAAIWIERFRDGRAEHNEETLAHTLGSSRDDLAEPVRILKALGFLEPVGATYKVPMLYRAGLNITQGKAFAPEEGPSDEDE
jgi:hypothetical protein